MPKLPGDAIAWSDADLDRLATVTVDGVTAARSYWKQHARPADRNLLEVGCDDTKRCTTALYYLLRQSEQATRTLSDRLAAGALDTAGWQLGMLNEVKMTHVCGVAAAKGGWARVTLADFT